MKNKIGLILNDDSPETPIKRKIGLFILFLIVISSIEVILESVVSLNLKYYQLFFGIDAIVSVLFTIEYILRLWTFRIDGEKPTVKQRLSHIFSFYMLIDIISIIPFYFSIFFSTGYGFLRIVRILRLFRLMKFARFMKSQNLVINAIKNKGKELILSMQVVVFLTVILSAILYHIENSVQPDNFGDILDAFVWSLSKFIGGVGGYGDFEPITFWGQVMATIVGLLGIALFAVPAGIIGAGFVEEIESIKEDEDLIKKNNKLLDAFKFDHLASHRKNKRLIGLKNIRRKEMRFSDAELRLMLSRTDIIKIADQGEGIKLRTVRKKGILVEMIESFEENANYGTFNNKDSNLTIISSHSADQPFLGHFTYAVSELLAANYISSEKIATLSFNPEYRYSMYSNPLYLSEEKSDNVYFEKFREDMLDVVKEKSTVVYFMASSSLNGSFHICNGGEKGKNEFSKEESTYKNLDKLEKFYTSFEKQLKEHDKTEEKLFSTIHKHKFYGNALKDRFHWMLHKKRAANIVMIYLSPNILKADPKDYYPIIKILGDNIKEHLL